MDRLFGWTRISVMEKRMPVRHSTIHRCVHRVILRFEFWKFTASLVHKRTIDQTWIRHLCFGSETIILRLFRNTHTHTQTTPTGKQKPLFIFNGNSIATSFVCLQPNKKQQLFYISFFFWCYIECLLEFSR